MESSSGQPDHGDQWRADGITPQFVRPTLPPMLNIRQAAMILGVHPDTIRRWEMQGKLPAQRTGPRRVRRYALKDVQRLRQALGERVQAAQRAVVEVARAITGSLDLHHVAETVVQAAVNIVGGDRCAIYLVNQERGMFEPLYGLDVKQPESTQLFYANPVPITAMPLGLVALQQGGPVVIDDTETHPLSNPEVFRIFDTRTFIAIGLRSSEATAFGVMTFGWTSQPYNVRDDDVFLAESLAALAAVALSNARLFAEREQERTRATLVSTIVQDVNSGRNLRDTLTRAIASLVDQLDADEGAIWLVNDDRSAVIGAVETRTHGPTRIGAPLRLAAAPNIARVAQQQQPALIPLQAALGDERRWFESLDVQASLFVPLIAQEQFVGMAFANYLHHTPHLTLDDMHFTNTLARQCALAIERVRLLEAASIRAAELEAVIGQMSEGLIMVDRLGHIILVNDYAAALYGMPQAARDPAAFNPAQCAYYPDGRPMPADELPVYRAAVYGETATDVECMIVRGDGSRVMVSGNASPIVGSDGERLGAVVVLHDITTRRQIETEKDHFLSIVSHELKTPLTTIKGLNELARRRLLRDQQIAPVVSNLERMAHQIQRMESLIGDLLDARRMETGMLPLQLQPVDLRGLVNEACQRAQATTERHVIQFDSADGAFFVQGDAGRLEQVLDNLLSNAIKYSPNTSAIRLTLLHENQQAVLRVSDQGIGIPKSGRDRLFERFYRGANVVGSGYSGMGIGLALSRSIAERHGGKLELEATSPEGSTFKLTLPLAPQAEHAA